MKKILAVATVFLLAAGMGAAVEDDIQGTWNAEKDGDGESSAVAVVATGHGDDVRKTIEATWNAEKDGDGESSAERVVPNNGNLPGFPANWDLK